MKAPLTALNAGRGALTAWVLALGGVVALGIGMGVWAELADWHVGQDSAVYRAGALNLLHGGQIYGPERLAYLPDWVSLPFIYPPAAALVFLPMAAVPPGLTWGLAGSVSVVALYLTIRAVLTSERRTDAAVLAGFMAAGAFVLEPVWKTVLFGQVNLLLMGLVVVDVLLLGSAGRWPRFGGVLVGIAAAVKLTPLIFVVHLLVVGRRADAARAIGTFAVLQAVMFGLIPGQAIEYWRGLGSDLNVLDTGGWIYNQSLHGTLLRFLDGSPSAMQLTLIIAAVLAAPAIYLVRRYANRGDPTSALLVTGLFGVLVSPISWSHHWVWAAPLLALLIVRAHKVAAAAVLVVFASEVIMMVPNGDGEEYHWGPVLIVLGNAYVLVPLVAGLVIAARWVRAQRSRAAPAGAT